MLSGVSRTAVRPVTTGSGWGGRQYDGRYDQRYGSYDQPYDQRGPYAGPYAGQDDRTTRHDPRGPQGGRWQ
jgi:hypothetical protein